MLGSGRVLCFEVEVCRFEDLGILVYVLTPHVLSDGNVEWCSLISMCSCLKF